MDLEELNKSQIVLLTILVSFVTSIATGIVTASLVERAPADVVRIMQRVVEKVTPATLQQATVVTREKTIVIKEADLISAAIAKNEPKIISIVTTKEKKFVSLGVFINTTGVIAMDASTLSKSKDVHYSVRVGKDTFIPTTITYAGGARGVALLQTIPTSKTVVNKKGKKAPITSKGSTNTDIRPIIPAHIPLHLGQTIVAFLGKGSIAQGITSKLGNGGYIGTSINAKTITPGALLINVNGNVVGISTGMSRKNTITTFAPIRAAIAIEESGIKGSATSTVQESTTATTTGTTTTTAKTSSTTTKK